MANTLLTVDQITRESLRILHQKLNFVGSINRQYDDRFAREGAKIGDTLRIRLPNEYVVTDGAALNVQDTEQTKVSLEVSSRKHVGMNFSSQELTMDLDNFSENVIDPAMSVLAANVEYDVISTVYKEVYNEISDVGATITLDDLLDGQQVLTDSLTPPGRMGRRINFNTQDNRDLVDSMTGFYNPQGNISSQFREGMVANNFLGFGDVYENTLMPTHVTGSETANTYRTDIAAAEADGSAGLLHIDTGATTFKKGDIIEIQDVYDVHPETKVTRPLLKRFVVTADHTAGEGDLAISPNIVATGGKQNVSAAAADGKIIYKRESDRSTAIGASADYKISLAYHKDAFTFATADLELPRGVHFAARKVFEGISLRIVRQYDINTDNIPCRVDVLYGKKALRPQWATRFGFN